jgi:hypothetical protein
VAGIEGVRPLHPGLNGPVLLAEEAVAHGKGSGLIKLDALSIFHID